MNTSRLKLIYGDVKEVLIKAMRYLCVIALVFIFTGWATQAHAGAVDSLSLPANDMSNTVFFNYISCGSSAACSGWFQNATPLTSALGAFNDAIMFLGGLLILYTLFSSILDTAHQGEFMGKRWSSGYLPIRIGIGSAMLMPIINGICGMQILVMWIAWMGAAMGTTTWSSLATSVVNSPTTTFSVQPDNAEKIALQLIKGFICQGVINNAEALTDSSGGNPVAQMTTGTSTPEQYVGSFTPYSTATKDFGWSFGINTNPSLWQQAVGWSPYAECGQVRIATSTQLGTSSSSSAYQDAAVNSTINSSIDTIQGAESSAFKTLGNGAQSIASAFVTNGNHLSIGDIATIKSLAGAYASSVTSAVQTSLATTQGQANQEAIQSMTQAGWLMAGTYYIKLVQVQTTLTDVSNAATIETNGVAQTNTSYSSELASAYNQFDSQIATDGTLISAPILAISAENGAKATANGRSMTDSPGMLERGVALVSDMASKVAGYFSDRMKDSLKTAIGLLSGGSNVNPLLQAQNLGAYVTDMGTVMTGVTATVGIDAGLGFITGSETMALYSLGATLQFFLPFMPYLIFMGGAIGWMILVVEALIGASLWAVAHIFPDGSDNLAGRAGQGYTLVVDLALRPTLMILGLDFALFLLVPIGSFINQTFVPAFQMVLTNTNVGPVLYIAVIAAYCSLFMSVMRTLFGLITYVPDNVLRWFGGLGNSQLGGHGTRIADEASGGGKQGFQQAAPNLEGAAGAPRTGRKMYKDSQERKQQKGGGSGGGGGDGGGDNDNSPGGSPDHQAKPDLMKQQPPAKSSDRQTAADLNNATNIRAARAKIASLEKQRDELHSGSPIATASEEDKSANEGMTIRQRQSDWLETPEGQQYKALHQQVAAEKQELKTLQAKPWQGKNISWESLGTKGGTHSSRDVPGHDPRLDHLKAEQAAEGGDEPAPDAPAPDANPPATS